jgi:predicted NBD/HSP70 family sugar kinase
MFRLGIDLGGTKIEAALLNPFGDVVWRKRVASPRDDYRQTLQALIGLIDHARQTHHASEFSIGLGIPGSLSPVDGRVRNANSTWLNGQALKTDLEELLSQRIAIANDANCLAISEATDGAARDARSSFAVILGTGVGGGLTLHKKLVVGANGIAGEWGHTPLPWQQADEHHRDACWCGRRGCIETFLSGPALVKEFNMASSHRVANVESLLALRAAGDVIAKSVMERFFDRLARALAMVINIVDPDVIVVGGGLSNIDEIYTETPQRWQTWIFSDRPTNTHLLPAMHGDSSGVRGAAWLPRTHEMGHGPTADRQQDESGD